MLNGRLRAEVISAAELSAQLVEKLYRLYESCYDATDPVRFRADLEEKQWVILLRDIGTQLVAGFSTQMLMDLEVNKRLVHTLFSGDTIIHPDYWGSQELVRAWCRLAGQPPAPVAVRSSALLEDRPGATFAGQFDTFLGIDSEPDFLTAVRGCWASLWATRALRYMQAHDVDVTTTAMAVLVQRLVPARASGGALSRTPEGSVALAGAWGLGSAIAQGEVVPDRFLLDRDGVLVDVEPGRKDRLVTWSPERGPHPRAVAQALVEAPCLDANEAVELGRIVLAVEAVIGAPVEVEWALGEGGFVILQARPLSVKRSAAPDELWLRHPSLTGQPAGVGHGSGPARIVVHEHDLEHVALGEVLVTQIAGPALAAVLTRVAGVVAELGGSTSHLAALARERGIPAVLGVRDATRSIPSGALVAVDGVTGVVRWMR